MSDPGPGSCSYDLDEDLRIVAVDAGWCDFAVANGAPELLPPGGPLGRPVLTCIKDRSTAILYQRLYEKVRRTGQPVRIPFRCDAPDLRRFLELTIEPLGESGLRVRSRLIQVEPRHRARVLDPLVARSGPPLQMCSFCKAVNVGDHWCEVEEAVRSLDLFTDGLPPPITHGVCPACYERAAAALDQ